ncbi:acetoacetate--CoA ligase [Candidatus Leptofilum sp.]|uniref:acetoacetate--CoA ligase n=1 Tax=Candidatus Leptofilum sp. TaxID=3241576 RepID=UPI003B5A0FD0
MIELQQGDLLWQPSAETVENANLTRFMRWLAAEKDLHFGSYDALWQWSVTELGAFWQAIWDFCEVKASRQGAFALANAQMPGAVWFPEARLNYAENIFAQMTNSRPAFLCEDEDGPLVEWRWAEVYRQTAVLQHHLKQLGIGQGDRVVAYLPNIPEAIIACLATVSLGAIWSSASPDFGSKAVLDRFAQIEPKLLIAVDGYRYNGRPFDRRDIVNQLQAGLPTLENSIVIPLLDDTPLPNTFAWPDLLNSVDEPPELTFAQLPFDYPLWILYSSGTTGLPKPIVHGHGGNLLEHKKAVIFHNDLRPGDRFFWYTSTGWMMWNYQLGALLSGSSIILYNGSPSYPMLDRLWALAERSGMTYFGLSPAFVAACMNAGIQPNQQHDLSKLRGIGSTGAPLPVAAFEWLYQYVHDDFALESLSGGTDLCTAFVGGCRIKPVYAGEIQGASLGAKVQAWNGSGEPVVGEVGELVIAAPMPSMPIRFWNDPDGARYQASYFETFPSAWRHGDWIQFNERGGCVIYGRSDATINRKGIRMGTSEIYACVEAIAGVLDSLVVDLELLDRDSFMPLFVILAEGRTLDDNLRQQIEQALRTQLSPRHVPDAIYQVQEIPYTLSSKKLEIPVRRILLGHPVEKAANLGAMRNPESINFFVELAQTLSQ